jgi:NAD(P)-dependent dehydrogenase (short-subunit alcohol dehydrogenase family)
MKTMLKDKVIIVTGGNGLIGKSIIKRIIDEGGIAINAEINVITDLHKGIINCDITSQNSVEECITQIIIQYGKIDGWVNNAYPRTDDWSTIFEEIPLLSWKKNIDMQLNSIFICCQLVLSQMKKQGSGSIVNISSIYGVVGPDFSVYEKTNMTMPAAYSAIKGGVVNFTRYLASYYGGFGIRINCVSPGGIFDKQSPEFISNYEKKVPMKRLGDPEDVSPSVTFLLGNDSKYITGHNLIIDGGWTSI